MRRERQPKRQSNNAPVAIAIGLCAGGLLLFLALRGETPATPVATSPSSVPPSVPPDPPPDPLTTAREAAARWFTTHFFDAMGKTREMDGAMAAALFAEGEKRGYASIPEFDWSAKQREVFRRVLVREPDHPDANRAFGKVPLSDFPDLFAVFRRLTDAKALPDDLILFRRAYEDRVRFTPRPRAPALEKAEYERAAESLRQFLAFEKQMAENPTERAIFENLARVRLHAILGKYQTVRIELPPYILFYASRDLVRRSDDEAETRRLAEVQERLQRRLLPLREFMMRYRENFKAQYGKPLKLAPLDPTDLLFLWVFEDRESWEEYGKQKGAVPTQGLLGYFSLHDYWIYLYEDKANFVVTCVSLAHEMTHQLHWHYSKSGRGSISARMNKSEAAWFSEGWAEYLGWREVEMDASGPNPDAAARMSVIHNCRKWKLPIVPLREMVRHSGYGEWLKAILLDWLPKVLRERMQDMDRDALGQIYMEMLYAEGWLFTKFLHEYGDGKYHSRMLRYIDATLKGFEGFRGAGGFATPDEVFAEVMALRSDADWDALQKEFDGYVETMIYKFPPSKK